VGGSFWYARRLSRRWRAPAFAFVERAHVSRTHQIFERIFVPTADLQDRLTFRGVPPHKVTVTGDPRYDAVLTHQAGLSPISEQGTHPRVTFLAGSRDTVFSAVFPFWVKTAAALRARLPHARLLTIISPFVSPEVQQAIIAQHQETLTAAAVEVQHGDWGQIVDSDLVLTIPGTNTLELALLRIPSMVVLPFSLAPQIPIEGLIEWVTRIPRLGPPLRLWIAREYVRRRPYVALPNMRVGRQIMPELIGAVTPEQVADESARLIRDERARLALARALEAIPLEAGASRRILDAMRPAWTTA
jgi:lipid-A-disaccharide synthase